MPGVVYRIIPVVILNVLAIAIPVRAKSVIDQIIEKSSNRIESPYRVVDVLDGFIRLKL